LSCEGGEVKRRLVADRWLDWTVAGQFVKIENEGEVKSEYEGSVKTESEKRG
jgi:hypothetical protein